MDGIKIFGEMINLFLSKKARFQFNQGMEEYFLNSKKRET